MSKVENDKIHYLNWLLNISFCVAFSVLGFLVSTFTENLKDVEQTVNDLPKEYILKVDYQMDYQNLLQELNNIKSAIEHTSEVLRADSDRRMDKLEKLLTEEIKDKN